MNIHIYTCISLAQIDCSNNICEFVMLALCTCHQQCHVSSSLTCTRMYSFTLSNTGSSDSAKQKEDEANALVMVVVGRRSSLSLSPVRSEPRCVNSPITEERRDRENGEFAGSFQATKEKEENEVS